jgi:hypothetical protein
MRDFFELNDATLAQQAPAVAQKLWTIGSREGLEVLQSRAGAPVFRAGNITLHSPYDPQAEPLNGRQGSQIPPALVWS